MSTEKRLTADQAAALLECTPLTVTGYCRTGALRAAKPGRRWLIERADLDAFIDAAANRPRKRRS